MKVREKKVWKTEVGETDRLTDADQMKAFEITHTYCK